VRKGSFVAFGPGLGFECRHFMFRRDAVQLWRIAVATASAGPCTACREAVLDGDLIRSEVKEGFQARFGLC
jgi:hypothetical protein